MRRGRSLYANRMTSRRKRNRSIPVPHAHMHRIEVRLNRGEVWLTQRGKICWIPKSTVTNEPGRIVSVLEAEGFSVSNDFVDDLLVWLER